MSAPGNEDRGLRARGDAIVVDGVAYVRAYNVASDHCPSCGAGPRLWRPREVLAAIRLHVERTGHAPSRFEWSAPTPDHPEWQVAHRMFGTWSAAIREAGCEPQGAGASLFWTRERIIDAIQIHAKAHQGRPPTAKDWSKAAPEHPATPTVQRHFGSWSAAIDAAGFFPRGPYGARVRTPNTAREKIGKVSAEPIANVLRRELSTRSLDALAEVLDVDPTYIGRIISGKLTTIRADYADKILCALDHPHVFNEAAA